MAVCDDWGIGRDGDMVVSNRADMRHFVRCTKGHTVIMGRKTLESFPGARPLKDRRNIVLTRDASFLVDGAEVAHSVDEALALIAPDEETWVVGGGAVYRELLPYCSRAIVTRNRCVRLADTFFPDLGVDPAWRITSVDGPHTIQPGEGDAGVIYEFLTYERVSDERDGKERGIDVLASALDAVTEVVDLIADAL